MPVSKRDKKVSLTKTTKKGMGLKQKLVENIRKNLEIHENLFVFTTRNMRNGPLKNARETWEGSRFFMGKPKVMAIALGRTEAEEQHKNLHKVSPFVRGQCGLLLTSKPKDEVIQWFRKYSTKSFARSGFVPTETIKLEAGPLPDFAAAMEPHLRSLGLPTQLEKGKIVLRESHVVCTQDVPLTPEQAGVLKLLRTEIAEFKLTPLCVWSKDGSFEKCKVPKDSKVSTETSPKPQVTNTRTPKRSVTPQDVAVEKPNLMETSDEQECTPDEQECTPDEQECTPEFEAVETQTLIEKPDKQECTSTEEICSPKINRENPRRSMRTPKPIKRSPGLSVKKLTESTKNTPTKKITRTVKKKL